MLGKHLRWVLGRGPRPSRVRFDGRYNKKAEVVRDGHHITIPRAQTVFRDEFLFFFPAREEKGEKRWFAVGITHDRLLAQVLFTIKGTGESERIRVFNAWPADEKFKKRYIEKRRQSGGFDT